MKFIRLFFASALAACLTYYACVLLLIRVPLPAEYWVGEMITIKKALATRYEGKNKIIVAGGSSTLFGVDTEYVSKKLAMPVINFGLHAGLKLEKILGEAGEVTESNDVVILLLEPAYFDCHEKPTSWQVENMIAWDHAAWAQMDYAGKAKFIMLVSPTTFIQMVRAGFDEIFFPAVTFPRLSSLDDARVLSRFVGRTRPSTFEYSAYHLNDHGDMRKTEGARVTGAVRDANRPNQICARTATVLMDFVAKMKSRGVSVYFANIPYIVSGMVPAERKLEIRNNEIRFKTELMPIGCLIDQRENLLFDRKYFFDTSFHLNAEGRSIRSALLVDAIRRNVLSGTCHAAL